MPSPSFATRVLLTGAFGGIGRRILNSLVAAGHRVRCLDLRNPRTEKLARKLPPGVELAWGNICDRRAMETALRDVDVVVHMAAIIPPLANTNPDLATSVNFEATKGLIELMENSQTARRLVFASSMAVAGWEQSRRNPPLTADEPPAPSDHYGKTKARCETLVKASTLKWTILRIAACPHDEILRGNQDGVRLIFETSADARIELVHFDDAATAFSNAVGCDEAIGKILFVGGGSNCRTEAWNFYNGLFAAMGLGPLPRSAFRPQPLFAFGDWLDTRESQALLKFQHHTLDDFYAWLRKEVGPKRYLFRIISPLATRAILKLSPYWRSGR